MPSAAADFPVVDLHGDFFNLIPSRFPPVDLFERIASGRDTEVAEIENATNPRIRAEGRLTAESPYAVDERPPKLQNWNLAPFSYPNPEGSVLFDRTVQCLELSGDVQTALAVSVAKRERFLRRTSESPIGLDMRMLKRAVKGRFMDARVAMTSLDESRLRELGESIFRAAREAQCDGVMFHTRERPSGIRIVVLNANVLERAIQCEHYRFQWNGNRVSKIYTFDNTAPTLDNWIDPEDLKGERDLFAA